MLSEDEKHELICLREAARGTPPCSPHCAGYLRELQMREVLAELLVHSYKHYGVARDETCGVGLIQANARALINAPK